MSKPESQLRRQLTEARDDYRAARYHGDLAFDVLPGRMTIVLRRMAWSAAASGAIAAAVILTIWLNRAPSSGTHVVQPTQQIAMTTTTTQPSYTPFAATEVPSFPSDVTVTPSTPSDVQTLVPSYQAIAVASVPSFPSFDTVLQEQTKLSESTSETSNTQESQ